MNYKDSVDVSIEYAHTYLGKPIGKEHELGAKVANSIKEICEDDGLITAQLLLIDDYNSSSGNKEEYSKWYAVFLESMGIKPTHLVWEADCVEPAKRFLQHIPHVEPGFNQPGKYTKNGCLYLLPAEGKRIKVLENGKYQCPLLAVMSEASQLGLADVPHEKLGYEMHYSGKHALIILPYEYTETEGKVKRIFSSFYSKNANLHHLFFSHIVPDKDQLVGQLTEYGVINHVKIF